MKITVDFNTEGVRKRIQGKLDRVQFDFDQQVAKDSNFYCPQDVGTLKDSVLSSAASGKGLLEWDEIYARNQYYDLPNKSKDKNPNARMKWFEVAKTNSIKKWEALANREYNK